VAEASHAFEDPVAVVLSVQDEQLHLSLSGTDGGGLSLRHMRDRMEATGGSVTATSGGDGRTVVEVRAPSAQSLPVVKRVPTPRGPVHAEAAVHASRRRSGPNADLVT
jgi:hypothetical protein